MFNPALISVLFASDFREETNLMGQELFGRVCDDVDVMGGRRQLVLTKNNKISIYQGFGSGSVSGSALIWVARSGSGSRRAKITHKSRKKSRIFMFLSTGCSLLRVEGFSCSLGVLYGGLGISKLQFLIKKIKIIFPAINFFSILGHQTLDPGSWSGSGIRIWNPDQQLEKMLDPDPYPDPH
jgi:hypothetical protein